MTTTILKRALLITFLFGLAIVFRADIIPENSHRVNRTVIIENCSAFNSIEFIGYVTGPMVGEKFYIINDNQQLSSGYKHNSLQIFGIKKTVLDSIGGIDNLNKDFVLSKITPLYIPTSGGYYIDNNSMLSKDDLVYKIVKLSSTTIKAVLKTRTLGFTDGSIKSITY